MTNHDLAELINEVAEEEAQERGLYAGLLHLYDQERTVETMAKRRKENLAEKLRSYLQLHEGERLWDGERGLEGFLETRKLPGHKYDLLAISQNNPALFARLADMGCLRLDHAAVVAAELYPEAKRYEMPSGETTALQVVKIKQ